MSRASLPISVHLPAHPPAPHWTSLLEQAEQRSDADWFLASRPEDAPSAPARSLLCLDAFSALPHGLSLPQALSRYDAFLAAEHPLLADLPPELLSATLVKTVFLLPEAGVAPANPKSQRLLCLRPPAESPSFPKADLLFQSLAELSRPETVIADLDEQCIDSATTSDVAAILLASDRQEAVALVARRAAACGTPLLLLGDDPTLEACRRLQACYAFHAVSTASKLTTLGKAIHRFLDALPSLRQRARESAEAASPRGAIKRLHDLLLPPSQPQPPANAFDLLRSVRVPRFAFLPTPEETRDTRLDLPHQPEQSPADRFAAFAVLLAGSLSSPDFHYDSRFLDSCARDFLAELLYQRHGLPIPGLALHCRQAFRQWPQWIEQLLEAENRTDRPYATLAANRRAENAALLPDAEDATKQAEREAALEAFRDGVPAYRAGQGSARNLESLARWLQGDLPAAEKAIEEDYASHPLARDRGFETAILGPRWRNDLPAALALMERDWRQNRLSPAAAVAYLSALARSGNRADAERKAGRLYRDAPELRGIGAQIALHLANDFAQSLEGPYEASHALASARSQAANWLAFDRERQRESHESLAAALVWQTDRSDIEAWLAHASETYPDARQPLLLAAFRALGLRADLPTAQHLSQRNLHSNAPDDAGLAWAEFLAAAFRRRQLPFAPLASEDRDRARAVDEAVRSLYPEETFPVPLVNNLAHLRIFIADTDEAANRFRRAAERHGPDLIRFSRLALYAWSLGHESAARELIDQDRPTLACPPGDLFGYALAQALLGRTADAAAVTRHVRQLAPQLFDLDGPLPANLLLWLSLLAHALGDVTAADRYRSLYAAAEPGYQAETELAFLAQAKARRPSPPDAPAARVDFPVLLPTSSLSRS